MIRGTGCCKLEKTASVIIICGAKGIMDKSLLKAAREGDVNTLRNLLEEDPQILQKASSLHFADSPLHVAALSGKADFVKQTVSLMPSLATETNQQGMIPLHLASLQGHVETVKELLKAKLLDDDDRALNQQCLVKDEEGWTALHCSSQKGKIKVMEELIRECPQGLEQVTAKGDTVLHLAAKANQFGVIKLLAESLKRHNLQKVLKALDQKGKTAYGLAEAKKQLQVLELLKEEDDQIREERTINVGGEGSESTEACKEEEKISPKKNHEETSNTLKSHQEQQILVVATLFVTLTYQALVNPPSTLFKDGATQLDWSCVLSNRKQKSSNDLRNILKSCPAILPFLFLLFNTLIFIQSILVMVITLQGKRTVYLRLVTTVDVRLLTANLILCYSTLLTATGGPTLC